MGSRCHFVHIKLAMNDEKFDTESADVAHLMGNALGHLFGMTCQEPGSPSRSDGNIKDAVAVRVLAHGKTLGLARLVANQHHRDFVVQGQHALQDARLALELAICDQGLVPVMDSGLALAVVAEVDRLENAWKEASIGAHDVVLGADVRIGRVGEFMLLEESLFRAAVLADGHRFGTGASKMIVSPAQFEAQLEWLAKNRYQVLSLDELAAFLAGRQAVPQRSVVITIDDGYESVYRHAYPALKKYGFTATLFVYSDFVGARDALSWAQLQDMAQSRVIDIQAHSKTHRNLIERLAGESDSAYRQNIDTEVKQPRWALERQLATSGVRIRHFAFPFGDANEPVLQALQQHDYALGLTVNAGGNAHFADPLMLRRTMIYGDHSLEDFKSKLQLRRPASSMAARP